MTNTKPRFLLSSLMLSIIFQIVSMSPARAATLAYADTTGASAATLAYERDTTGGGTDIWIWDQDGNSPVNLTNSTDGTVNITPSFSPDGQKIAYCSRLSTGQFEIWMMDSSGASKRRVTNNLMPYACGSWRPVWSTDGQWLYFSGSSTAGDREAYKVKVDGTGVQQLTNIVGQNTLMFDISRNFTKATFARGSEGNDRTNRIYVSNADFSDPQLIGAGPASYSPVFSRDGSRIAYSTIPPIDSTFNFSVHVINTDGTSDAVVTTGAIVTDWSPADDKLVVYKADGNMYWINTDGTNLTLIGQGRNATTTTSTAKMDCLFNWAEVNYASLFAPSGATSVSSGYYYFRYYSQTNSYVGVSSTNGHLYYIGSQSGDSLLDVGAASTWYTQAGCS